MCDIDYQRLTKWDTLRNPSGLQWTSGFPWAQGKAFAAWPGMPDGKLRADCPIIGNSNNVPWRARRCHVSTQWRTLWLFNIAMENCPFTDDFPS